MSLEVELLHRIESLEARVKACEEHHHEEGYHEHLIDEDEIKSILERHAAEASKEIEKKEEEKDESSKEDSEESEPAAESSSEEKSSEPEKKEEKEEQRPEVEPNRRHFLHRKVGGKHAA